MAQLNAQLHCLVVTPDALIVDAEVFDLVLPAHDGLLGILPGHAPMLCQLAPGLMRYHDVRQPRQQVLFINGGILHVREDELTVLTPQVVRREDMTFAQVEQMLHEVDLMPRRTARELEAWQAASRRAHALLQLAQRR